jgi:LCP family protein required for cell wall assembly
MKPICRFVLFCGLMLALAACSLLQPAPPARTAVPTWTLPAPTRVNAQGTPLPPDTATPINISVTEPPLAVGTPTPSPTARPGIDPTLGASTPDASIVLVTAVPEPAAQLHLDPDIVNILLVGRDTPRDTEGYRTDVMIVASLNKKANSVTLLTLPRDLFVYIPGWTMNRLNTAAYHGDAIGYPGGGMALLEQTILYNLGIPIHGWARIDFGGFKQVVDIFGGVDIPVSCEMADWRLKSPGLDQQNADNWEMFTVTPGLWHMDGDMALWYARSRKHSSDFDRSRRQHQVLRAMFDKATQLGALAKAPELYQQYAAIVDTDLGLGDVLQFIPMAAQLNSSHIKSRFIGRDQVYSWTTPAGAAVLLPDRAAIEQLVAEAFLPPSENVLAREAPSVEIWNGTKNKDWAALAADNLAWAGIIPVIGKADATNYATTTLYDFTASPKGSPRAALQTLFHLTEANTIAQPDSNAAHPFRIVLGSDYDSCARPAYVPHATPTPGPGELPIAESDIAHAAAVNGPPPSIDGDLTEWTALVYPANQPVFGRENWQGTSDASASWNVAWDNTYLYLAVKVRDDVFVQNATGENLFKGDGLELLMDIDPGQRGDALTERDFQLGLSPGNLVAGTSGPEAYRWWPKNLPHNVDGAKLAARLIEGGYALEAAIPWTAFNLTPFSGEGMAFTLSVSDNDALNTVQQQSLIASIKDRKLTDPRTWGILVLDPPPGP